MKTVLFLVLIVPLLSLLIKEFSQGRKIRAARAQALAEQEERRRRREEAAGAAV